MTRPPSRGRKRVTNQQSGGAATHSMSAAANVMAAGHGRPLSPVSSAAATHLQSVTRDTYRGGPAARGSWASACRETDTVRIGHAPHLARDSARRLLPKGQIKPLTAAITCPASGM